MLIETIAKETGASLQYLRHVIQTASRRYRTYEIDKRTGGKREISHPTPLLKFLQRWIVRNVISHLPVHASVRSYRLGDSVLKNACAHVSQNYLLKMDFSNFFPSITSADIRNILQLNRNIPIIGQLNDEDIEILLSIVCRNDALTIGAPSSPAISNSILFEFDSDIAAMCASKGIIYTRYADDLSFSTSNPNKLAEVPMFVANVLARQRSPRLRINDRKTVFSSRKNKRVVTGLILTADKKISIGREKKRWARSACFKFKNGELSPNEASHLRGYLSFVQSVEPSFIASLRTKFGADLINKIISQPLVSLKRNTLHDDDAEASN